MRNIILHHHFFKNAGATLMKSLSSQYGEKFIELHPSEDTKGIFDERMLDSLLQKNDYQVISSHHLIGKNYNLIDFLKVNYRFYDFVLIRHPLARLLSIHRYYNLLPKSTHPIVSAAQEKKLGSFLKHLMQYHPNHLLSPQVCNLSGGGILPPSRAHLRLALNRVEDIYVCGIVENYDDTMIAAEYYLKPIFPTLKLHYSIRENVSKVDSEDDIQPNLILAELGDALYDTLLNMNELDIELWEFTKNNLNNRLRYIPFFDELKKDFQSRCVSHIA